MFKLISLFHLNGNSHLITLAAKTSNTFCIKYYLNSISKYLADKIHHNFKLLSAFHAKLSMDEVRNSSGS